ncbi:OLC1v1013073C1 [Oldenlandia corymbosa var. corymbosa]|uniref:OLC1v1013073C1 n=1 Tax=Oldenlandia corymbosa var. corymbosa TaxID=529605 RepID=A0AAV1DXJ2_OLDCO|nr:OLC1v1013073C1 [Oldenlandia corymbosa var. corymbosa]
MRLKKNHLIINKCLRSQVVISLVSGIIQVMKIQVMSKRLMQVSLFQRVSVFKRLKIHIQLCRRHQLKLKI